MNATRHTTNSASDTPTHAATDTAGGGCPEDAAVMAPPLRAAAMMVGGALGDALGAVIEFASIAQIRARYGPDGILDLPGTLAEPALITDDTQMSLFTLEGLIRGYRRTHHEDPHTAHHQHAWTGTQSTALSAERVDPAFAEVIDAVHDSYQRWLYAQHQVRASYHPEPAVPLDGWLLSHEALHQPRGPGNTCLTALRATSTVGAPLGSPTHRLNNSKGCGAVMRAAPVALWPAGRDTVFRLAMYTGALTHSHPTGYLAAGTLAVIIRELLRDASIPDAVSIARAVLTRWPQHEEVLAALDGAVRLADRRTRLSPEDIASELGGGWAGEQTLAIALYAALRADDFADGVQLAVNHSGDSDSTGALAGSILGAHLGYDALPDDWPHRLELLDVIVQITLDAGLAFHDTGPLAPQERTAILDQRYPID